MIITKTPLRISFVGGGTDMPSFYQKHGGAVVSMAIDKYMYIGINRKFDGRIRLSYSETENVDEAAELKHELAKACLNMFDLKGVEIFSVADIPGAGTGLGSSSAYTVGLLKAIHEYIGKPCNSATVLAEEAFMVEMGCGHSVGKQDHYASAYGDLHFYGFCQDGHVEVEPIALEEEKREQFQQQCMLFWTGKTRKAEKILKEQSTNLVRESEEIADKMRELAYLLHAALIIGKDMAVPGRYLNANWELKKQLASDISAGWIDDLHSRAIEAGAAGAKICGAGGGGFMFVWADPERHAAVETALGLRRIVMGISKQGSEVVYAD